MQLFSIDAATVQPYGKGANISLPSGGLHDFVFPTGMKPHCMGASGLESWIVRLSWDVLNVKTEEESQL